MKGGGEEEDGRRQGRTGEGGQGRKGKGGGLEKDRRRTVRGQKKDISRTEGGQGDRKRTGGEKEKDRQEKDLGTVHEYMECCLVLWSAYVQYLYM